MSAVNFTDSPSNGDTVTVGGVTYTYSSSNSRWEVTSGSGGGSSVSTEDIQDAVADQFVTNGSHSGISFSYDDNGDGAIDVTVSSAPILTTARTIGGVSFNGSANIDLPGVNTVGNQNTTGSAATLTTARTIGGVSFNGSSNIDLPGVNTAGNQNTTGSAATLTTARTIGGVSFDGSANIDLPGVNTAGNQNTTGSAATLTTARTIGGVSFNGSANIDLPGVNTAGNQNTTGNAATATALQTARTIAGVSFDGSANIDLPGVNTTGTANTSGNAATATALQNARTIHGVSFDGTANIDLTEVIQDTVGSMFTNNTESNITVTYEDSDGTIDLVASGGGGGGATLTADANITAGQVVILKSNGNIAPISQSQSATAHGASILSQAIVDDALTSSYTGAALQHDEHTGVTVLFYWTTGEAIKAIPFTATTSGITTGTAVDITTNTQTDYAQVDGDDLGRMAISFAKKGSPTDSYNTTYLQLLTVSNPSNTPTITLGGLKSQAHISIGTTQEAFTSGMLFDRNVTLAASYTLDVTVSSSQFVFAITQAPYNNNVTGTKPAITLTAGATIIFDQSDSSNSGHQIGIRNSDDTSYTTGVTVTGTPGQAGAKTTWVIPPDIDVSATYKYYCTSHGNDMGNSISFNTKVAAIIRSQHEWRNYNSSTQDRQDLTYFPVTGAGANLTAGNSTYVNIGNALPNYFVGSGSGNRIWNRTHGTIFDYNDSDNGKERRFEVLYSVQNGGGSDNTGYNYGHVKRRVYISPESKTWHGGGTFNGAGNTAYNSTVALNMTANNSSTNSTAMRFMYNASTMSSTVGWTNLNEGWIFEGWSKADNYGTSNNNYHDRWLVNVDQCFSIGMNSSSNTNYRRFGLGAGNSLASVNVGSILNNTNLTNWWHWAVVKPVGSASLRLYLNTSLNSNTANFINSINSTFTAFNQHITFGSSSNRTVSSFDGVIKDFGWRKFNSNNDAGLSSANDTSLTWWATSNTTNLATTSEGGAYDWNWRAFTENVNNTNNIGSGLPFGAGGKLVGNANAQPTISNTLGSFAGNNNNLTLQTSNLSFFGNSSNSNSYYGDSVLNYQTQPRTIAKDGTASPQIIAWGATHHQNNSNQFEEAALRTFTAGGNATANEVTAAQPHWGSAGNETAGEWSSYQYAAQGSVGYDPVVDRVVFWIPAYKISSTATKPAVKVFTYSNTGNHTNYTAGGATEGVVIAPMPSHLSENGVNSAYAITSYSTGDASSIGGSMTQYISGITGFLAPYYDKTNGKISIYRIVATNHPVTDADDYLGIVDTATSSGATASVKLVGSISDQQSSLTVGRDYFVDGDGSLTTTNTGRLIGRSLSATELLLIDTSSEEI